MCTCSKFLLGSATGLEAELSLALALSVSSHPRPVAHSSVMHKKAKTSDGNPLGYKEVQSQRSMSEQDPQLRMQREWGHSV